VTIYGAGSLAAVRIDLPEHGREGDPGQRRTLLSFMDDEITEALSYHLRDRGCIIRHEEQFESLEPREHDVLLNLKSGRRIKSDLLLWANGRTGNTDGMNLRPWDCLTARQVEVNEHFRTGCQCTPSAT
jgi:NAD(P) transhydrogenase